MKFFKRAVKEKKDSTSPRGKFDFVLLSEKDGGKVRPKFKLNFESFSELGLDLSFYNYMAIGLAESDDIYYNAETKEEIKLEGHILLGFTSDPEEKDVYKIAKQSNGKMGYIHNQIPILQFLNNVFGVNSFKDLSTDEKSSIKEVRYRILPDVKKVLKYNKLKVVAIDVKNPEYIIIENKELV